MEDTRSLYLIHGLFKIFAFENLFLLMTSPNHQINFPKKLYKSQFFNLNNLIQKKNCGIKPIIRQNSLYNFHQNENCRAQPYSRTNKNFIMFILIQKNTILFHWLKFFDFIKTFVYCDDRFDGFHFIFIGFFGEIHLMVCWVETRKRIVNWN